MPINWNEIDKLKLEYIQKQEADKIKYEKDLKAYEEKKKILTLLLSYLIAQKNQKSQNIFILVNAFMKIITKKLLRYAKI